MKRKRYCILSGLIYLALTFSLLATPAHAAYNLSLATTDGAGNNKTSFLRGDYLYLHITVNDLQGIAGCAFTLSYDASCLIAPATSVDGLPTVSNTIYSQFPFTFVKAGHADNGADTSRENSGTAGTILFSGASINTDDGGPKYTQSTKGTSLPLFVVKFQVRNDAPVGASQFSLNNTALTNTVAGYSDSGNNVPVLVGSLPKTDANFNDLTKTYPTLLAAGTSPYATALYEIDAYHTIQGAVSYSGIDTGNLVVAAHFTSDTTWANPFDKKTYSWPSGTTSKNFALSVLNGTYYLKAFLDKNGNGILDNGERQFIYSTPIVITGVDDATSYNIIANNGTVTLAIAVIGEGAGSVTSDPTGINCGTTCSASLYKGTQVTLTASGKDGSVFSGWSEAGCVGSNNCTLIMDGNTTVTATFTTNPENGTCGTSNGGTFTSAPTANLCSTGSSTSVSGSGPWSWSCTGSNGGATAGCSANIQRSFDFDIDGNGRAEALTDGLLILRYLFGFRDDALTRQAVATGASRATAAAVENHLKANLSILDIDGNGSTDALTDGLLILRYLFGFRGDALTRQAVGDAATRISSTALEGRMQQYMPQQP